jgi:hypothetical protein
MRHLAPPLCTRIFAVFSGHARTRALIPADEEQATAKLATAIHNIQKGHLHCTLGGRKTPRWVDSWCGMCGWRSLATHYFACERQRFAASASKLRPRPFHARASSAMLLFAAPREIQFSERTFLQRSPAPTEHGHGVVRCM